MTVAHASLADELIKSLPKCGLACLIEAISTRSSCVLTDTACACANQAVQDEGTACVLQNCTIPEALTTQNLTNSMCGISSPHDRSYIILAYALVGPMTLFVALRFFARLRTRVPLWWDDFAVLAALGIAIAFTVVCGIFDTLGVGRDLWAVPQDNITTILKLLEVAFLCYILTRCLARVSICMFLMRIFSLRIQRRSIQVGHCINLALSFIFILLIIFQCKPLSYFWDRWDGLHQGQCLDPWTVFLAGGITSASLDVFYIALPVYWVLPLRLSPVQKLLTVTMLSLGVILVGLNLGRIVSLYSFSRSTNITRDIPKVAIWVALELDLAIICACLPSLKKLLKPLNSRFKNWMRSTNGAPLADPSTNGHGRQAGSDRGEAGGNEVDKRHHTRSVKNNLPLSDTVVMTTTIEQRYNTSSDSEVSLTGHDHVEMYNIQRGEVQGHVWD